MKRRLAWLILGVALVGMLAVVTLGWRAYHAGNGMPSARVRVQQGASLGAMARQLEQRDLLEHPRMLLLMARLTDRDRKVQVGVFTLPADASARDILHVLVDRPPDPVVVTLPEGMEAAAMAAVVADSLNLDAADLLAAADGLVRDGADTLMSASSRRTLAAAVAGRRPGGAPLYWCEGYLAPDTYHFAHGLDAPQVAALMVRLQLQRLRDAGACPGGYHDLLTLASLVEAEARLASERTRVAAVYHNRLRNGLRLEADPTVAFWLGKRGQRLLYRDLEVDSPFNTYRRAGLPAGPVLAPGAAAIAAAAAPDPDCHALYFVADGQGGHVFSETLEQHQAAVARYRELMRSRRR